MSDVDDIRKLVADLAIQADSGGIEDYLVLFTEDAVWEMPANADTGVPAAYRKGRDDIRVGVEERRAMGVQGPGTAARHHITTLSIDVAGDEASGHVYYQFLNRTDAAIVIQTLGEYRDTYRRTPEGWRLAHRVILLG